jgi:hypothetical protein
VLLISEMWGSPAPLALFEGFWAVAFGRCWTLRRITQR